MNDKPATEPKPAAQSAEGALIVASNDQPMPETTTTTAKSRATAHHMAKIIRLPAR